MRVLIDLSHPAHVHFYRRMRELLLARGDDVLVVSRDKEVTIDLLEHYGIEHVPVGQAGERSTAERALELLQRDLTLARLGRRFRADVVLTRNPAGAQAARLLGVPGIFDTDDGTAVGIHWRAAAPFATVITSPRAMGEDHGPRHWPYPTYKWMTYLHPSHHRGDPTVRDRLGLAEGERLFILRLVAMDASHDVGRAGIDDPLRDRLVHELSKRGRLVISSETPLPDHLRHLEFQLPAVELLDAIAVADLVVGDSQTVCAEAAIQGTPVVRASPFAGQVHVYEDLEDRYQLIRNFRSDDREAVMGAVVELADDLDARAIWAERRDRMLADQIDLSAWYLDLVDLVVARSRRAN